MSIADRVAGLERRLREERQRSRTLRKRCERLTRMVGRSLVQREEAAGEFVSALRRCAYCRLAYRPASGNQRYCAEPCRLAAEAIQRDAKKKRRRDADQRRMRTIWAAKFTKDDARRSA